MSHPDQNAAVGLRARKRAATFDTIERQAIALVLDHGYENVTIEMICEASMVSERTFFNYFGSKESVILGPGPVRAAEELRQRFIHEPGVHILGDLVELITAVLTEQEPDLELLRTRREIIHRTPELGNSELARMHAAEDDMVSLVMERFAAEDRSVTATPDLKDEARMVVALTTGVAHSVMRRWCSSNFTASPATLLRESIDLVHRVTKNSSGCTGVAEAPPRP